MASAFSPLSAKPDRLYTERVNASSAGIASSMRISGDGRKARNGLAIQFSSLVFAEHLKVCLGVSG